MDILEYIYIYTHQKPIGWFSRPDRPHTGTTIKETREKRKDLTGRRKKRQKPGVSLAPITSRSARRPPQTTQTTKTPTTPTTPTDPKRTQTDLNRIPDGPRTPAGKPRLARLDLVGYRPSLLFVPVQTSNSIFTASPPLPPPPFTVQLSCILGRKETANYTPLIIP
jgi:hypothetical protein